MPTEFKLSGVVIDKGTEKPLSGATVKMETPTEVLLAASNQYGLFEFAPIEVPDLTDDQTTYNLSVFSYYGEGRQQEPRPEIIAVKEGETSREIEIKMVNRGPVSNVAGGIFLAVLIAILCGLGLWYYNAHKTDKTENTEEVNNEIVDLLTEGLVDRITADSIKVNAFVLSQGIIDSADLVIINAELDQIKGASYDLFSAAQVDSAYQRMILSNFDDVSQAIVANNKAGIQAAFSSSKGYIKKIPSFRPGWFWQDIPGIYYEMFLWALFATLLRLIGNTSYYVSRSIFYSNSIFHKAALLFTIPFIALLIAFVISFFKISIFVGGADFVMDFSNPYISIIIAALIGLAPWRAWEFMYGLADKLFQSLKTWLGLNKKGDVKSEGDDQVGNKPNNANSSKPEETPEVEKPSENTTAADDSNGEDGANSDSDPKPNEPDVASGTAADSTEDTDADASSV